MPIPPRLALMAAGVVGGVGLLYYALQPHIFRRIVGGLGAGVVVGSGLTYVSRLQQRTLDARVVPVGMTRPPPNYRAMEPTLYAHLSADYNERGQLDLGEEAITVAENVFAQIGVLDVDGVRAMWLHSVLPHVRGVVASASSNRTYGRALTSVAAVERHIVFCDVGSGVGNVCLQVLAETQCARVVGVEVIPSRHRAAVQALANGRRHYAEVFDGKEAVFIEADVTDAAARLRDAGVNVVFTHSWMFDDDLMRKLTGVLLEVPTVACVVTSRELDPQLLAAHPSPPLALVSRSHHAADWNSEAPFFVYARPAQ